MNNAVSKLVPAAATLAALFLPAAAVSQTTVSDLNGVYHLSNDKCADEKTGTCFVYVEIRGDPAKAIYDNMRSKPQDDACGGGTMKIDKEALFCSQSDINGYVCFFGYDFVRQKIVFGDFSC